MAKKGKRPQQKKWSRANLLNFALGTVVVLSMVMSSIFVVGSAQFRPGAVTQPTAVIVVTNTPIPAQISSPTGSPTPTLTK